MSSITVIKRNPRGEETWRYAGEILERGPDHVLLEARFNRPDLPFMDTVFKNNDRFVETFYTGHWYNVFEVHDRDDDQIKGWYCNIGLPAVIEADDRISYVDLALDLWVTPDGKQSVLDRDEFDALALDGDVRAAALAALKELQGRFDAHRPPR